MNDAQQLTDQEMITDIIEKYQGIILKQKEVQSLTNQKITTLARRTAIFFSTLMLIFFSIIFIFTNHIQDLNDTINTMTDHFSSMTNDVSAMNKSVKGMETSISHLPHMLSEIKTVSKE